MAYRHQRKSSPFPSLLHSRRAMLKATAATSAGLLGASQAIRSATSETQTPAPEDASPPTPTPQPTVPPFALDSMEYLYENSSASILLLADYLNSPQFDSYDWFGNGHYFYGPSVIENAINAGLYSPDAANVRNQVETPHSIATKTVIRPVGEPSDNRWGDYTRIAIDTFSNAETAQAIVEALSVARPAGAIDRSDLHDEDGHIWAQPFEFENGAIGTEWNMCLSHRSWHTDVQRISPDPNSLTDDSFATQLIEDVSGMSDSVRRVATIKRAQSQVLPFWKELEMLNKLVVANRPVKFVGQQSFNVDFPKYGGEMNYQYQSPQEARDLLFDYFLDAFCTEVSSEVISETNQVGYTQTTRNFLSENEARIFFEAQPTAAQDAQHASESFRQVEDVEASSDNVRWFHGLQGADPASMVAIYGFSQLHGPSVIHFNFLDLSQAVGVTEIVPDNPQWVRLQIGTQNFQQSYSESLESTDPWPEIPVPEDWTG